MPPPKYLVTGGAGFIGTNLVRGLVARGHRVRALDNLSTGSWGNLDGLGDHVECITGDIRDESVLQNAMQGVDVVFHKAAIASVTRSIEAPVDVDAVNTLGTVKVLSAARSAGVRRVVFAASSAAYGDSPLMPKTESMMPEPLSPYAASKLAGEHYMRVFHASYGMETLSLRYFNIFGPYQRPDGAYAAAIPRFIHRALSKKPIEIYGDGEQSRDFCFVANVVEANLLAAFTETRLTGQCINIASGDRITLNDLCAELRTLVDTNVDIRHVAPRPGDIRHSGADLSLAERLLGYRPATSWRQGLPSTIAYLRSILHEGTAA